MLTERLVEEASEARKEARPVLETDCQVLDRLALDKVDECLSNRMLAEDDIPRAGGFVEAVGCGRDSQMLQMLCMAIQCTQEVPNSL
jgi:hypothetical protein